MLLTLQRLLFGLLICSSAITGVVDDSNVYSLEQLLKGRFAGVVVSEKSGEPGSAIDVNIRGISSLNCSNSPLYVVDGIAIDYITGAENGADGLNLMNIVNPCDIESIRILKDGYATALYGSRGANGVIVITTRQGAAGAIKVKAGASHSVSWADRYYDLADGEQFAHFFNSAYQMLHPGSEAPIPEFGYYSGNTYVPGFSETGVGTDWQKALRRTANSGRYDLSVSGGNSKLSYYFSGAANLMEGVIVNNDFNKYNLKANIKANPVSWLEIKAFTGAYRSDASRVADGILFRSLMASPMMSVSDDVSRDETVVSRPEFGQLRASNPYLELTQGDFKDETSALDADLDLNFILSGNLSLSLRGNALGYKNNISGTTMKTGAGAYMNYFGDFSEHTLNAFAGVEAEKKEHKSDFSWKRNLLSAFVSAEYSYRCRYALGITLRSDGSSVLGNKSKWNIFPAVGLVWDFASEGFISGIRNVLTSGRIRLNYGVAGNQPLEPYLSLASLAECNTSDSKGNSITGLVPGARMENPYLTCEITSQIDAGVDFGLFGRVSVTADVYKKMTTGLIQNIPVSSMAGVKYYFGNTGAVENKGVELSVEANAVSSGDFLWDVNATFFHNVNEIIDLGPQKTIDIYNPLTVNDCSDPIYRLKPGASIGDFFGFRTNGLLTEEDIESGYPTYRGGNQRGFIKYVNQNPSQDNVLNLYTDGVVLGNAYPDYVIGLGSRMKYKGVSLSFMFNAALGQEIMNLNRFYSEMGYLGEGVPASAYIGDYYSDDNPAALYPRPTSGDGIAVCDRLVENGSYLRLSHLSLRYDIPLAGKLSFLKASVFVTGTNLFTLTGYSGYDPEIGGVDMGSYPHPRSITFGIKLEL